MRRQKLALVFLLMAVTSGAAMESFAQFGGGMRGGRNRPDGATMKDQRPSMQENLAEQVEDRLAMLEEDLRLAPGQQSAWQTYSEKVRALAADIVRERTRTPAGTQMNALQQIDRAVDVARNRLTALEDVAAAAKTLYTGLTHSQQSIVDARLATITTLVAGGGPAGPAERTGKSRNAP